MIRKVVIPAAGIGSRFYPLTRAQPKEMLPLVDRPVIQYVVEEAVKSGLDEILIIVGSGKDAIINYFDRHRLDGKYADDSIQDLPDVYFIRQKEQKGLADSIRYAKNFTGDEDFVVLLGDTVYHSNYNNTVTSQLIKGYNKNTKTLIGLEKVDQAMVNHYGIVSIDCQTMRIKKAIEKPEPENAPSNLAITGTYIFNKDIYDYIAKLKPGKNNELQLTDAINMLCTNDEVYGSIIKGKRYDIGTIDLWLESFLSFLNKNKKYSYILDKYIK
jgi:UTP--glucose-1-phosphate uridylyltransferase